MMKRIGKEDVHVVILTIDLPTRVCMHRMNNAGDKNLMAMSIRSKKIEKKNRAVGKINVKSLNLMVPTCTRSPIINTFIYFIPFWIPLINMHTLNVRQTLNDVNLIHWKLHWFAVTIQIILTHIILMTCFIWFSPYRNHRKMPTHRSLTILALALAHILVAADARYERGIYLSDAPENINPDDLYNEMVWNFIIDNIISDIDADPIHFSFNFFENIEICWLSWRVHRKLAIIKGIPRDRSAKKCRKASHASRNIESYRRKFKIDGSSRWTIANTTCVCQQHQSTSIQEIRSQLLYV